MCGPTVFTIVIDNHILFMEPYPLAGTSENSLCIRCEIPEELNNDLRRFINSHFNDAWKMSQPVPITEIAHIDDLEPIIKKLRQKNCITAKQAKALKKLIKK